MNKQKTAQQIAEEAILFKSKKYYTIEQMADTIEANSNALNKILSLPRISIPKKIAEEVEKELKNSEDKLYTFNKCYEDMTLPYKLLLHKNYDIICAYLNPLTRPFVEVEDE